MDFTVNYLFMAVILVIISALSFKLTLFALKESEDSDKSSQQTQVRIGISWLVGVACMLALVYAMLLQKIESIATPTEPAATATVDVNPEN